MIKIGLLQVGILFLCLGLFARKAFAEEPPTWRGFFTTGLAWSSGNVSYNDGLTNRARILEETTLGLNVSHMFSNEYRFVAQLLSQADIADAMIKADWAFVEYKPLNSIGFLIGKQKIPIWIIGEFLEVGRAYPWIRPPEEVYDFSNLRSFTGVSARLSAKLGGADLAIEPYAGNTILETAPNAPTALSKIDGRNMFGFALTAEIAKVTSLRAALNQTRWDLNSRQQGDRSIRISSLGFTTKISGVGFISEYALLKNIDEKKYFDMGVEAASRAEAAAARGDIAEAAAAAQSAETLKRRLVSGKAYYGTFTYEFGRFLAHATYANLKKPFQPNQSRDQSSNTLGLNYDLTPDSVIKMEAKKITVPHESLGLFKPTPGEKIDDISGTILYGLNYNCIF